LSLSGYRKYFPNIVKNIWNQQLVKYLMVKH
jgi:hypothetical protein